MSLNDTELATVRLMRGKATVLALAERFGVSPNEIINAQRKSDAKEKPAGQGIDTAPETEV